jgi:D-glycero-D-manno-heptose 1,7-bisphosphate phosphatase
MDTNILPPTAAAKVVVLDRDGVINQDSDSFIKNPDEWIPIPGSLEAIARLTTAGFRVIVATNQSGIDRGLFDTQTLIAIHTKMHQAVNRHGGRIDAIFFCPHSAGSECECRKPKPGMFYAIEERFHLSLSGVPCVGDSLRDLQAASYVGGLPVLVRTGKGTVTEENPALPSGTVVYDNLDAFVTALLT